MVVIGKEEPQRGEDAVLIGGDNISTFQWVLTVKGRKDDVRAAGMKRIFGALEVKGKWCF